MEEIKESSKKWIVGVVMLVLVLFGIVVVAGVVKSRQSPILSPLMAISVHRCCDWVSLDNSTTYAVCLDNTKWRVVLENAAAIAEMRDSPVQDPGTKQITISADDDHGSKDPPLISGGYLQDIRYSNYWPPLCGVNCFRCVDGICVSKTTSGARWEDWTNKGVACPKEWEFGTTVTLDGKTWTCVDHGGKIKFVDGIPWIDFMRPKPAYDYGTIVKVRVIEKGE